MYVMKVRSALKIQTVWIDPPDSRPYSLYLTTITLVAILAPTFTAHDEITFVSAWNILHARHASYIESNRSYIDTD